VKRLATLLAGSLYLGHLFRLWLEFKGLVHADQEAATIHGDEMRAQTAEFNTDLVLFYTELHQAV
jgi:hypothetical protein